MLRERRTKHVEYRAVKLADIASGAKVPDGSLIVPIDTSNGEVLYGIPVTFNSTDAIVRLAKPVFSEAERFDTLNTGKTIVLEGRIEFSTDQFIAANANNMTIGTELTVTKDTDGFLKFDVASGSSIVVAKVGMAPADHPDGHLVVVGVF